MILEQQLFRNYNELYQLILCCYKDISILKVYEKMQKDKMPTRFQNFVML